MKRQELYFWHEKKGREHRRFSCRGVYPRRNLSGEEGNKDDATSESPGSLDRIADDAALVKVLLVVSFPTCASVKVV